MKNARQAEIMNIIQNTRVETQEQLLEELRARGFTATNAGPFAEERLALRSLGALSVQADGLYYAVIAVQADATLPDLPAVLRRPGREEGFFLSADEGLVCVLSAHPRGVLYGLHAYEQTLADDGSFCLGHTTEALGSKEGLGIRRGERLGLGKGVSFLHNLVPDFPQGFNIFFRIFPNLHSIQTLPIYSDASATPTSCPCNRSIKAKSSHKFIVVTLFSCIYFLPNYSTYEKS